MLCNDDGIEAEGINVLYNCLAEKHEVFVIAPEREMSGSGASITTKRPLFPKKIKENFFNNKNDFIIIGNFCRNN